MSTEFDDVLTNQPVVIDNVSPLFFIPILSQHLSRALALSRLALLAKIVQNASFPLCTPLPGYQSP